MGWRPTTPLFSWITSALFKALTIVLPLLNLASTVQKSNDVSYLEGTSNLNCSYNRLMPSLEGDAVAVSRQNDSFQDARNFGRINQIPVFTNFEFDLENGLAKASAEYVLGSSEERLIPLFWADGQLILRLGARRIVRGSLSDGWHFETTSINPAWEKFEVTINSREGLRALDDDRLQLTALSMSSDERLRRRSVFLSESAIFSAIDISDMQSLILRQEGQAFSRLGLGAFYHRLNVLTSGGEPKVTFLGNEGLNSDDVSGTRYALPIIDYGTGEQIGLHRPDLIEIDGYDPTANSQLKDLGYTIKDAAFAGGKLFVLAVNTSDHSVFVFQNDGSQKNIRLEVCKFQNSAFTGVDTTKLDLSAQPFRTPKIGLQLSADFDTTGVLFQSPRQDKLGLIVYFHGGPARTVDPHQVPRALRSLWLAGHDILAIEYSGSVGGGLTLSNGLATKNTFGFGEDAKALRQWLGTQEYRRVHSYAVSYGTLPALFMASSHPELFDKKVFVAPLLRHPSIITLEESQRFSKTEQGAQLEFEKGLYGSDRMRMEYISFIDNTAKSYIA